MIARNCSLALYEDARIHVQHLSARASVEEIARAKAAGRPGHLRGDARITSPSPTRPSAASTPASR